MYLKVSNARFQALFDLLSISFLFRHSGAPDGYKFDTINFYDGEYFMGREQYLYQDAPQLNYDNLGRYKFKTSSQFSNVNTTSD